MQWPKEKVQKNKQRSTKHTHKAKDQETRTTLKCDSLSGITINYKNPPLF